jgi:hypothetical protein
MTADGHHDPRGARIPTALVLSGGSATGAYQAGVLRGDSSISQYQLGKEGRRRCGEARH